MNLNGLLKRFGKPATEIEIQELEKRYSISIPDLFKKILFFSDGAPVINRYIKLDDSLPEYTTGFFSVTEIDFAIQHMLRIEDEFHYYFSDVMLPIGDSGGSRLLCIGLSGSYKNGIYIIDYQSYDGEKIESMITFVSSSLEDLFKNLRATYEECV